MKLEEELLYFVREKCVFESARNVECNFIGIFKKNCLAI